MLRKLVALWIPVLIAMSSHPVALAQGPQPDPEGWVSLFDGKSLDGWKFSEKEGSFSVKDGMIVVAGNRSHLFYMGPVANADFKDFEFKAKVMTTQGSNSGIYFHTEFYPFGWPVKGYECQVNNSHTDPKRTGGLYGVSDVFENLVKDNEWFDYFIKVEGKHIIVQINGKTCVDFTEPEGIDPKLGRKLSSGTFALQAHDPKSTVTYKDIFVKPLPSPAPGQQP